MASQHHPAIEKLRNRFHFGTIAFVIIISLAMQLLLDRYAAARAQAHLASFRINAELKARQIDLRFRLLADHVQRLRALAEQAYDEPRLTPAPALFAAVRKDQIVGYELPRQPDAHAMQRGNFYAHAPLSDAYSQRELDVAWSLFPAMIAQHQLDDALRWSGIVSFHSGNWAAYPYQSIDAFLVGASENHIRDALLNQYQNQFFVSLKQTLLQHDLVWRSPSFDQAGTGYIVSIFAPVWHQNELEAYVLADVQLQFLVALLRADLPTDMHIEILTQTQELIADSAGSHPTELRSSKFYPVPKQAAEASELMAPSWQLEADRYRLSLPLTGVNWLTTVIIEQARIDERVAADIQPLRHFQLLLIGLMLILWWLLARYFVTPSLLLADMASQQHLAVEPRLPRIWQDVKAHLRKLVLERRIALRTLEQEREQLEQQVRERTRELQNQNTELEAFNFAVSHDLRAPLRAIDGFVTALKEDCGEQLDANGQRFIDRAKSGVVRMEELIEALLALSHLSRVDLQRERLNLSELAEDITQELRSTAADRVINVAIEPDLWVHADRRLMRAALENLLSNAFKYTGKTAVAEIRFFRENAGAEAHYVVADNGAGFDMHYAARLFTPFQRMHRQDEFTGTGVGLSTVQRIIHRHGGEIWAEAEVGKGAKFRFSLP